jgi:hypothetical protein
VIENDGMRLLLKHMIPRPNQHPAIEKLKYSVLRAIYSLISSEKRRFSEHFVECEGIDVKKTNTYYKSCDFRFWPANLPLDIQLTL